MAQRKLDFTSSSAHVASSFASVVAGLHRVVPQQQAAVALARNESVMPNFGISPFYRDLQRSPSVNLTAPVRRRKDSVESNDGVVHIDIVDTDDEVEPESVPNSQDKAFIDDADLSDSDEEPDIGGDYLYHNHADHVSQLFMPNGARVYLAGHGDARSKRARVIDDVSPGDALPSNRSIQSIFGVGGSGIPAPLLSVPPPKTVVSAVAMGGRVSLVENEVDQSQYQKKHFTFTYNNYPDDWDVYTPEEFSDKVALHVATQLQNQGVDVAYLCCGKELAPTTGTRHLQGFMSCVKKMYPKRIRKAFSDAFQTGIHILACLGTPEQNYHYCRGSCVKKNNVVNPYFSEFGVLPKSSGAVTQAIWDDARAHAIAGTIDLCNSRIFISQFKNLESIHAKYGKREIFTNPMSHRGIFIYSKRPGVGKTESIKRAFEGQWYPKMMDAQWNLYKHESVSLLDDLDATWGKKNGHLLKLWCDHRPFPGDIKYGTVSVHLRYFFITSNWSLDEIFGDCAPEIRDAVYCRFKVMCWDDTTWETRDPLILSTENLEALKYFSEEQ